MHVTWWPARKDGRYRFCRRFTSCPLKIASSTVRSVSWGLSPVPHSYQISGKLLSFPDFLQQGVLHQARHELSDVRDGCAGFLFSFRHLQICQSHCLFYHARDGSLMGPKNARRSEHFQSCPVTRTGLLRSSECPCTKSWPKLFVDHCCRFYLGWAVGDCILPK